MARSPARRSARLKWTYLVKSTKMNLQLTDKTALISGSTKGIGFAIAAHLAAEGARVILNGRSDKSVSGA